MLKGIKFTFKNQKLQTPQNICSHCACNWHYQHLLISPLCSTCPIMKYAWERNRPEDFFSLTQRYLRGRQEDFWDIREVWPSLCQLDLRKITQIWYSYQLVSTLVSSHMQECSSRAYRSIHTYIPTNKPEKTEKIPQSNKFWDVLSHGKEKTREGTLSPRSLSASPFWMQTYLYFLLVVLISVTASQQRRGMRRMFPEQMSQSHLGDMDLP